MSKTPFVAVDTLRASLPISTCESFDTSSPWRRSSASDVPRRDFTSLSQSCRDRSEHLKRNCRLACSTEDRRGTVLTPVGEQLLVDATSLLSEATATTRRVRRAAAPESTIAVGVMPGLLVTGAIAAFRNRHPRCRVDVQPTTWATQVTLLREGSLDLSLAREPFDGVGLQVVPIASEERLALLPLRSALAESDSLTVADLASLPLLQDPALLPQWAAATSSDLLRRAVEATPPASVEEKLERVAQGEGFVVLPRSTSCLLPPPRRAGRARGGPAAHGRQPGDAS